MLLDGHRRLRSAELVDAYIGDNTLHPSFELRFLLIGVDLGVHAYQRFLRRIQRILFIV